MYIDISSIKIKKPGGTYVDLGNFNNVDLADPTNTEKPIALITEAKYEYNKLWTDAGRSLSGNMTATLIGIFPKIIIQFKKLTKTEAEAIIPILDSTTQIVRYYDPNKKAYVEMETYTGDYELVNKKIINGNGKNEPFGISFIAVKKRV